MLWELTFSVKEMKKENRKGDGLWLVLKRKKVALFLKLYRPQRRRRNWEGE
jgi:hypothetical protein